MTRFIIVCPTRSGSNLMVNLLNSHKNVLAHGEIFSIDRFSTNKVRAIIEDPIKYVELNFQQKAPSVQAVGFKMLYDNFTLEYFKKEVPITEGVEKIQKSNKELSDFLQNNFPSEYLKVQFKMVWKYLFDMKSLKVVHLKRQNFLCTYLSLKRAFHTYQWIKLDEKPLGRIYPIVLNKEDLLLYFNRIEKFERLYNESFAQKEMLHIDYEELVGNREEVVGGLCDFLEIENSSLNTVLKKQSEGTLRDNITNYDDLKKQFKKTKWSKFFLE